MRLYGWLEGDLFTPLFFPNMEKNLPDGLGWSADPPSLMFKIKPHFLSLDLDLVGKDSTFITQVTFG